MLKLSRSFLRLYRNMCMTGIPFASFSNLAEAYKPVIASKWFEEICKFNYEANRPMILAHYIQSDSIKDKLKNDLVNFFPEMSQ